MSRFILFMKHVDCALAALCNRFDVGTGLGVCGGGFNGKSFAAARRHKNPLSNKSVETY